VILIDRAAKKKYMTMKINENAQCIVIPIDIESAIVIARPPSIFIKLMRSILETWPLYGLK
jgi:hypothetical protein